MSRTERVKGKRKPYKVLVLLLMFIPCSVSAMLFGYEQSERSNLTLFPQWLSVLERNIKQRAPEGNCNGRVMNQCHLKSWLNFISSIRKLNKKSQLEKVNRFANKQDYVLDIENYGVADLWATPREFLYNNGDCEDYAIIKMLSLKMLGFKKNSLKLVVLQDTNLRIPHAVLAVEINGDTVIMDNQIEEIISHEFILHYVPIYAVNESKWWMFFPK